MGGGGGGGGASPVDPGEAYKVASCSRPLEGLPEQVGNYLPYHQNVVSESAVAGRMELGFFAVDMNEALAKALMYADLMVPYPPYLVPGLLLFSRGELRQDANLGTCNYESNVSKERYDTVRKRMETYDWTRYHLIATKHGKDGYGTCITWAESVLAP